MCEIMFQDRIKQMWNTFSGSTEEGAMDSAYRYGHSE